MPLSPHFILPTPCTFMTSRSAQPLPSIRELFPDLFHPRSMPIPDPPSPFVIHDPQQPDTYQLTNPRLETPRHLESYDSVTAQDTATSISDRPHRYTRASTSHSHAHPCTTHQPTLRWPYDNPVGITSPSSASPELSPHSTPRQQIELGPGPSSLPDNETFSSPMTPSPHVPSGSTDLPLQPTSFGHKSLEPHSGKKRHRCNVCGSYWGRPSSLKIHMVSHTGIKEFVCSVCKQDFGVKSNYTRHIKVHHRDSSEGIQARAVGRRRRGSRKTRDVGPVRFVDEGPRFQGQ